VNISPRFSLHPTILLFGDFTFPPGRRESSFPFCRGKIALMVIGACSFSRGKSHRVNGLFVVKDVGSLCSIMKSNPATLKNRECQIIITRSLAPRTSIPSGAAPTRMHPCQHELHKGAAFLAQVPERCLAPRCRLAQHPVSVVRCARCVPSSKVHQLLFREV
jgi:hypothetical protein